ncbi:hypothetical protein MHM88_11385 [Epibacterium sp. MM17-32]|uniref:hypothetical protein n=1 Tax=Epibacterium sp. MM17-32 TaxID=2917734 RepID=UPI001EF4253B|nr:hypothetical protein [Epibacterium sp. MM17-32]MCG7628410.1 hypothetical protein [Epibacterium sp. MM17-32]
MNNPWKLVETFGGEIEGVDEEGYLKVYGPDGNPLLLIKADELHAALMQHFGNAKGDKG